MITRHSTMAQMTSAELAELAWGCLWMIDSAHPAHQAAKAALLLIIGDKPDSKHRAIVRAKDLGLEADIPSVRTAARLVGRS